ncbi:monocarboxylate transporter 13-like isoform X2 [Lingula anatina]|uniref:Monocarboxylate transporter 13-like isoform X2 n=1 Tax=Lingula anatina TaxID=7574 RepID=A0A1S3HUD7_LINAN|nr:monocarboxylate transporter 13-like isoform X2 [Lingula anatina]|eukprot:XP_013389633.1 monocarboxylate transporter 13-like isoform X2 [Lingula anatina]
MNQSVMSDSSPTVRLPNLALASSIQSLPHVGLPAAPTQDNKQDDNVRSLRDDVDGGWSWVVMVSVAFTFFISNGYGYTFGVFYLPILETFEEGETMTSVVGSIYIGLSQLAGILASVLCDKINCRMTCIIGSVATAVGLGCSTFATSCTFLIISMGIIAGDTAIMAETVKTEYLGTAMGVLVCASGIGFAFGPLLGGLIFSLTGAYAKAMQTAGGSLLASTLLMFLVKVKVKCTETRPGSTTSVDDVELEKDPNNSD